MHLFLRVAAVCLIGVGASRLAVHNDLRFRGNMGMEGFQAWEDDASRLKRIEELKKEIFNLVGLDKVKESMRTLLDLVEFGKMREKQGMHGFAAQSLHMRFLGNPGTGKTVVARLVGELLLAMGAITPVEGGNTSSTFVFKEASRADLVGEHTGATAIKVQKVVKEALGGVLFIDEAYALVQGPRDNFGVEAVDTLIKEMEDNRAHLIVILAGYTKEMDDFFNSNPGFQSRVPFSFTFADYTCPELTRIGELQLKSKSMILKGDWWLRKSAQLMTQCCDEEDKTKCDMSKNDRSNGNGRTIRNLLESSFRHMALRVLKGTNPEKLKAFDEVVKEAPAMDCLKAPEVNLGAYSGPDLRCDFSSLEGDDILATTADLLNLNLAPCKTSLTKEQVTAAPKGGHWGALAAAIAQVTETKTGSKVKLQEACSTVATVLNSGASLLQLDAEDEEMESAELEGRNPLEGYKAAPKPGWCQDKRGKMDESFMRRVQTLEECAELCDKTVNCTGFAAQPGACNIYKDTVPRTSTGAPRRVTCYQRTSAATAAGVPRLDQRKMKAWQRPGRRTRPTRPSRKPSSKHAQEVIEENKVPGGTNEKVALVVDHQPGIHYPGASLLQSDAEDEEMESVELEGRNPLKGYNAAPSPGACKDKRGKMDESFMRRVPLEECAELCDKTARCTGFAAQPGVCKIYKNSVPRTSTGSPRRLTCYQRNSAATRAGVERLTPIAKGGSKTSRGSRSSKPTGTSSGSRSGSPPKKKPSRKASWNGKPRPIGRGNTPKKSSRRMKFRVAPMKRWINSWRS